jgi:hypothetical protein
MAAKLRSFCVSLGRKSIPHPMKTVAECHTLFEANVIKGNLENEGFHPVVFDNSMNSILPFQATQGKKYVSVRVPNEEYQAAKDYLEDA